MESKTATLHPTLRTFEAQVARARADRLVTGALLASRDGFPVLNLCPGVQDAEVFAAMHATALGAAEIALRGIDRRARVSVTSEGAGRRYMTRSVTDDLFVVTLVEPGADCAAVTAWLEETGRALSDS